MFMFMGAIIVPLQGVLLGRLINRLGERRIILIGLLFNALGMALLLNASSFTTLTVYITITGIGSQLIRPTNASWISKQTQIGQGAAIGIMDAFLSLGRILGPLLGRLALRKRDLPLRRSGRHFDNCDALSIYPLTSNWRRDNECLMIVKSLLSKARPPNLASGS